MLPYFALAHAGLVLQRARIFDAEGWIICVIDDEEGVVVEGTKTFGQKAEVRVPEKLGGVDG